MKVEFTLLLAMPRQSVWRAFDLPSNLPKWQPSLISIEPVSGEPGRVGAVSRLMYEEGSRQVQMVETITVRNEPEEFSGTYDSEHGSTALSNWFIDVEPGQTRWEVRSETQLKGMARFMGPVIRGMIEGRVRSDCERFKSLLEAGELEF